MHLCLPHDLHTKVARDAFEAGIHVISEKPAGILYDDVKSTVELAEKLGLQYGVIFQNRFNVPAQLVKQRIADGKLGKVLAARTVLTWNRPPEYYSCTDWKGTWEREGGGVIINQSIHILDLANWFIDSTITDEYEAVRPFARHIHVQDAVNKNGEGVGVALGDGWVDFEGQFRALAADGYTGWVTLEPHFRLDGHIDEELLKRPGGAAFSEGGYLPSKISMERLSAMLEKLF